jgi:hypothetical protein
LAVVVAAAAVGRQVSAIPQFVVAAVAAAAVVLDQVVLEVR